MIENPIESSKNISIEKEYKIVSTSDMIGRSEPVANIKLRVVRIHSNVIDSSSLPFEEGAILQGSGTQSVNSVERTLSKKFKISLSQARKRALNSIKRAKERDKSFLQENEGHSK